MRRTTDFSVILFLLVVCCRSTITADKKLPSYLNVCKRFDPEIEKCWKKTLEELRPYLVKGIPEFKVPSIEPFHIDSLQLNQGNSGNIHFVADLSNLTFAGGKDYQVLSVEPNYKTMVIKLTLGFPQLTMLGEYKARGKVLLFQFDSVGKVEGNFKGIVVNGVYDLETYTKRGKEYLRIKRSAHEVQVESIYLYMHDLFRNNPEITANVNKAINDNIDVLYQDFKPLLRDTLGTIITEYTNRAYAQYTFDQLLPTE